MAKVPTPLIGCLLGAALLCWALIVGMSNLDTDSMRMHLALRAYPLHPAQNSRLVVSMSTFSRRVEASSLLTIQSIVESGSYERLIVSIPLAHRFGVSSQKETDESVEAILAFYGNALGAFEPVQFEPVQGRAPAFTNANHSIYLQFLKEDFGPATKLLGALLVEREPSTIILTVDDDIIYSPLLLPFVRGSAPSEAAFSSVCQVLTPSGQDFRSVPDPHWLWRIEPKACTGWLVGWAGVAYRVGFFADDVFSRARNLSYGCFLNDDVWLSGYLLSKGVPRVVFPALPGGMHFRHPTLSLSVIPDAQSGMLTRCAAEMGFE